MRRIAGAVFLLFATACSVSTPQADIIASSPVTTPEPEVEPTQGAVLAPPSAELSDLPPPPLGMATIEGEFEQGGWIRGTAPAGAVAATFDGKPLELGRNGEFFIGLDRDAGKNAELIFTGREDQARARSVEIAPRDWDIERVNVAKRPSGSSEEWWKQREPEWLAIKAAREKETGAQGWRQDFIWPVTGRISGRFGRQRIYRGEPGSYHSGLDIAPGSGVPFVAPADGVVVLARTGFSLEGGIIIVDHGAGLNSAFIHLSQLSVAEGESVEQGQRLGKVGASGRATGPHLHWSLMWRDARLDPLLFLPPMP